MKVYVTGIGIISAIGQNAAENLHSLKQGKSGIQTHQYSSGSKTRMAAPIPLSDSAIKEILGIQEVYVSRTSLLGMMAARECWGNNQPIANLRTGFISATSVGGMDKTELYYRQVLNNINPDYMLTSTHDSGNTSERIAAFLGITGYINTLSTACSSAANAIMLGARMIAHEKTDRVMVGGVDPLTEFTIKGFESLMIYDNDWCKPFDENRNGLNLGEGSAFLMLESEHSLHQTGNTPLCYLSGWHNAADAYHQTASSPEGKGATLAMKHALEKAQLLPSAISYINAHGTGTKNNDLSESVALKNIFGAAVPPFSSTKAYTGHTLAAAGAIEAVYSIFSLQHQFILPALNFSNPIPETLLQPATELKNAAIKNILSNSFGFGGNNSSLIFSAI
jgi:3-oxoacyl-[acyl-carrier-protein] synthase-1